MEPLINNCKTCEEKKKIKLEKKKIRNAKYYIKNQERLKQLNIKNYHKRKELKKSETEQPL